MTRYWGLLDCSPDDAEESTMVNVVYSGGRNSGVAGERVRFMRERCGWPRGGVYSGRTISEALAKAAKDFDQQRARSRRQVEA